MCIHNITNNVILWSCTCIQLTAYYLVLKKWKNLENNALKICYYLDMITANI